MEHRFAQFPAGQLPEGYAFCDNDNIDAQEIVDLRVACNWGTERRPEIWQETINTSLAVVGVRAPGDELVGVGILSGNVRHALLSDLTVHPDHRHLGIAKAIIMRRFALAAGMVEGGIPYIYAEILDSNTLGPLYAKLGFKVAGPMIKFDREK